MFFILTLKKKNFIWLFELLEWFFINLRHLNTLKRRYLSVLSVICRRISTETIIYNFTFNFNST